MKAARKSKATVARSKSKPKPKQPYRGPVTPPSVQKPQATVPAQAVPVAPKVVVAPKSVKPVTRPKR